MGAGRRQHHAQQEAMRAANEEANRQAAMMAEQQRLFQEQMRLQREEMMRETAAARMAASPQTLQSTVGAQNVGVRSGASKKKTGAALAGGAASLKIPLNLGGGFGSKLNIG